MATIHIEIDDIKDTAKKQLQSSRTIFIESHTFCEKLLAQKADRYMISQNHIIARRRHKRESNEQNDIVYNLMRCIKVQETISFACSP
jgi:hypothetical protein